MIPPSTSRARGPHSPMTDQASVRSSMVTRSIAGSSAARRDEPAEVGGEVAGAGHDAEAVDVVAGDRDVGDDAAALVEELRVDRRADRAVDVVRGDPLEERQRARPGDRDLAERGEVDEPDPLADCPVLLPHPLEPVRPCPASLPWHAAVASPLLARPMEVRALPAGLRAEHGACLPRAAGAAPTGGAAGPPRPRRTGSAGGSSRRRSRERGPPRTRDRGTCRRIATPGTARCRRPGSPVVIQPGDGAPDPSPTPEPVERQPGGDPEAADAGHRPDERVRVRRHRVGMADEAHRLGVGEEREAPDRALHERLEAIPVGRHARSRRAPRARRRASAPAGSAS